MCTLPGLDDQHVDTAQLVDCTVQRLPVHRSPEAFSGILGSLEEGGAHTTAARMLWMRAMVSVAFMG